MPTLDTQDAEWRQTKQKVQHNTENYNDEQHGPYTKPRVNPGAR